MAHRDGTKFKVVVVIPEVPGFSGDIKEQGAIKTIMAAQYRSMNRGGHSIYEELRKQGCNPYVAQTVYQLNMFMLKFTTKGTIYKVLPPTGVR